MTIKMAKIKNKDKLVIKRINKSRNPVKTETKTVKKIKAF